MKRAAAVGAAVVVVVAIGVSIAPHHAESDRASQPKTSLPSAAEVATDFLVGLSLPVMLDTARRNAIIDRYASARAVAGLRSEYAGEAERLHRSFAVPPRVAWTALVGHRDRPVRPGVAAVDVWAVVIGGTGASPVRSGWQAVTVRLVRETDGWKVVGVRERPAPPQETSAQRFADATRGFKEYRVAP